jgi:hypothetical protein
MKNLLAVLTVSSICFAQQDSTLLQIDRYVKESESITGSITKQIVQKDLTIQQLLIQNVQFSKEIQRLQSELAATKKDTVKVKK